MQLKDLFIDETSRSNTDYVKNLVFQKPELFRELVEIGLNNEEPFSRRAIWVMDACDEESPGLAAPYLGSLIDRLDSFEHDGLIRYTLRILSRHPVPGERMVDLIDFCFASLQRSQAAAIKVYAMEILYRLSCQFPDLKPEVAGTIEMAIREGSTGVKNRGFKLLEKLRK